MFEDFERFLRSTSGKCFILAVGAGVEEAEASLGMRFPSELRQLYSEVGLGLFFYVSAGPRKVTDPETSLMHSVASPGAIVAMVKDPDHPARPPGGFPPGCIPFYQVGEGLHLLLKPSGKAPNRVYHPDGKRVVASSIVDLFRQVCADPAKFKPIPLPLVPSRPAHVARGPALRELVRLFEEELSIEAEPFTYAWDGTRRQGVWSLRPVPCREAGDLVMLHGARFRETGARLFAGWSDLVKTEPAIARTPSAHCPLLAIPARDDLDVARFVRIGEHDEPDGRDFEQYWEDTRRFFARVPMPRKPAKEARAEKEKHRRYYEWSRQYRGHAGVLRGLAEIAEACPYVITFADPKGLRARFLRAPTIGEARRAVELALAMACESFGDLRPDAAARQIRKDRAFRLWWD